ncbi:MAG: hypothetical protein ACON4O_06055 [Lentimonas sp.]
MRRFLCFCYNLLASYMLLVSLLLAIVWLLYLGRSYKPLEDERTQQLQLYIDLKQKRQKLENANKSVEVEDLERRYALFNESFIRASDLEALEFVKEMKGIFERYGWGVTETDFDLMENDASVEDRDRVDPFVLRGGLLHLSGADLKGSGKAEAEFLPLHSLLKAQRQLWCLEPWREFQSLKVARTVDGFSMDASVFFPLMDPKLEQNGEGGSDD